jgi:hypothetical protein
MIYDRNHVPTNQYQGWKPMSCNNFTYSLYPKLDVVDLSRFACIYTLQRVGRCLDTSVTNNLRQMDNMRAGEQRALIGALRCSHRYVSPDHWWISRNNMVLDGKFALYRPYYLSCSGAPIFVGSMCSTPCGCQPHASFHVSMMPTCISHIF